MIVILFKEKELNLLLNHIILLVNHYMLNNNIIKGIITLIYINYFLILI